MMIHLWCVEWQWWSMHFEWHCVCTWWVKWLLDDDHDRFRFTSEYGVVMGNMVIDEWMGSIVLFGAIFARVCAKINPGFTWTGIDIKVSLDLSAWTLLTKKGFGLARSDLGFAVHQAAPAVAIGWVCAHLTQVTVFLARGFVDWMLNHVGIGHVTPVLFTGMESLPLLALTLLHDFLVSVLLLVEVDWLLEFFAWFAWFNGLILWQGQCRNNGKSEQDNTNIQHSVWWLHYDWGVLMSSWLLTIYPWWYAELI